MARYVLTFFLLLGFIAGSVDAIRRFLWPCPCASASCCSPDKPVKEKPPCSKKPKKRHYWPSEVM